MDFVVVDLSRSKVLELALPKGEEAWLLSLKVGMAVEYRSEEFNTVDLWLWRLALLAKFPLPNCVGGVIFSASDGSESRVKVEEGGVPGRKDVLFFLWRSFRGLSIWVLYAIP